MPDKGRNEVVGVMRIDRRGAPRFMSNLEVVLVLGGQVQRAIAVDVSMTGMRLNSEVDLGTGTQLTAHFSLEGSTAMNELHGGIVWSNPSNEIAGLYLAGLAYQRASGVSLQALATLIKQLGAPVAASYSQPLPTTPPPLPVRGRRTTGAPLPLQPGAPLLPAGRPMVPQAIPPPIAANMERAQLLVAQAHEVQRAGDLRAAVELVRQAVDLTPASPEILEELAAAVYLAGDILESAKLFDRALSLRLNKGG